MAIPGETFAFDYEEITTAGAAAKQLTPAKYGGDTGTGGDNAKSCTITTELADMRFTYHPGGAPSTTVGHFASAGSVINLEGYENIRNFSFARAAGVDVKIFVTYER